MGATLLFRKQESNLALCFPKVLALDFGMDWEGVGLAKGTVSLEFPETNPTFMGLMEPKEERMWPPDVAKVQL